MRVRMMLGVCGASAALTLAGCGSSSDTTAKFKSGYNSIRTELNATGQAIATELTKAPKQTDAQVQSTFTSLAQRYGSQVTKLGQLTPPSNLQADWNKVIQSATRIEADLLGVAAAARSHSSSLAQSAGASLARNAQALTAAVAPLKAKLGLK